MNDTAVRVLVPTGMIGAGFTPESVAEAFEEAGLRLLDLYTDEEDLFGLALGEPV